MIYITLERLKDTKSVMFADDTNLLFSHSGILLEKMIKELTNVSDWFIMLISYR